jgi:hypothetical protein
VETNNNEALEFALYREYIELGTPRQMWFYDNLISSGDLLTTRAADELRRAFYVAISRFLSIQNNNYLERAELDIPLFRMRFTPQTVHYPACISMHWTIWNKLTDYKLKNTSFCMQDTAEGFKFPQFPFRSYDDQHSQIVRVQYDTSKHAEISEFLHKIERL